MKYYKRINIDGTIKTVESYSHDKPIKGAIEIFQAEFGEFLVSLPAPIIKPIRDLATEIDDLKARIVELERK